MALGLFRLLFGSGRVVTSHELSGWSGEISPVGGGGGRSVSLMVSTSCASTPCMYLCPWCVYCVSIPACAMGGWVGPIRHKEHTTSYILSVDVYHVARRGRLRGQKD